MDMQPLLSPVGDAGRMYTGREEVVPLPLDTSPMGMPLRPVFATSGLNLLSPESVVTRRRGLAQQPTTGQGQGRLCERWREGHLPEDVLSADSAVPFLSGLARVIAAALDQLVREEDRVAEDVRVFDSGQQASTSKQVKNHFRQQVVAHEHALVRRLVDRERQTLSLCKQRLRDASVAVEAAADTGKRGALAVLAADAVERGVAAVRRVPKMVKPLFGAAEGDSESDADTPTAELSFVAPPADRRVSPLASPSSGTRRARRHSIGSHLRWPSTPPAMECLPGPLDPPTQRSQGSWSWQRELHALLSNPYVIELSARVLAAEAELERRKCFEGISDTFGAPEAPLQLHELAQVPRLLVATPDKPALQRIRAALEDSSGVFQPSIARFTGSLIREAKRVGLIDHSGARTPASGELGSQQQHRARELVATVPSVVEDVCQEVMRVHGDGSLPESAIVEEVENQVYPQIYDLCVLSCRDADADEKLVQSCLKWRDLTQAQAHVPSIYRSRDRKPYYEALAKLRTLSICRTPSRKLQAVRQAAQAVFRCMRKAAEASKPGQEVVVGGDDFVPVFVYAVLKANVRRLQSEVIFTYRFMNHTLAMGEGGYYLTTMELALEYLKNISVETFDLGASLCAPSLGQQVGRRPYSPRFSVYGKGLLEQPDRPCAFASPHVKRYLEWAAREPLMFGVALRRGVVRGYRLVLVPAWLRNPARPYSAVCERAEGHQVEVCVLRFTSATTELQRVWLESLFFTPTEAAAPGLRGVAVDAIPTDVQHGRLALPCRAHLLVIEDAAVFEVHAGAPFRAAFGADEIAFERESRRPPPPQPAALERLSGQSLDEELPRSALRLTLGALGCATDAAAESSFDAANTFFRPELGPEYGSAGRVVCDVQRSLQVLGLLRPTPHSVGVLCAMTEAAIKRFEEERRGGRYRDCGDADAGRLPGAAGEGLLLTATVSRLRVLMHWLREALCAVDFPVPEQPAADELVCAVENFQSSVRLRRDGRAGRRTLTRLLGLQSSAAHLPSFASPLRPHRGKLDRRHSARATRNSGYHSGQLCHTLSAPLAT
eukprot:TRINITY_DN1228_c10_g1_i1.p1 TRINITY_DN1228_c10_g1~~TRINITY_DN1228_c10_g1_i1.p1  ORF type:complete len:1061 (+),score=272.55 TRINITY_DN1228_c10_g1_i1:117-3299(+)